MGPDANVVMQEGYNIKTPPFWDDISKSFRKYKDHVENGLLFTCLEESQRGPAIIARLVNGPAKIALTLPLAERTKKDAPKRILEKLEKVHKQSDRVELSLLFQRLIYYRRTDEDITMVISEFMNRSDRVRGAGINLPDELLIELLIGCANITEDLTINIHAACGGDLTLEQVMQYLKQFVTKETPVANSFSTFSCL